MINATASKLEAERPIFTAPEEESIPVLTELGVELGPRDPAWNTVQQSFLSAALEGRETLIEILTRLFPERISEEGLGAELPGGLGLTSESATSSPVAWVPHTGRHSYAWVVIDLSATDYPALLLEGLGGSASIRPGLLITGSLTQSAPDHVDVISAAPLLNSASSGKGEPLPHSLLTLFQVARSILRTIPPSRVFLASPADALLLGEDLSRHRVAIDLRKGPLPASCSQNDRSPFECTAKGQADANVERLRWLVGLGAGALGDAGLRSALPWQVLASATLLLDDAPLQGRHRQLRDGGFTGTLLHPAGPVLSAFLTPNESVPVQVISARDVASAQAGVSSVEDPHAARTIDLTQRKAENAPKRVLFACPHLLGDTLAATAVLHQYRRDHPEHHLTFLVADRAFTQVLELSPDADRLAFVTIKDQEQLVFRSSRPLVQSLEYSAGFDDLYILDIQEVAASRQADVSEHMAEGYARLSGMSLESRRPSLDRARAFDLQPLDMPETPYVVFARHTVSGRSIGPQHKHTKRWAESKWKRLAGQVQRELGCGVVSIGTPGESPLEVDLVHNQHDLSILEVAGLLARAKALVCVDNGVFHLGLALQTPLVHLQPEWLGSDWTASPKDGPHRDVRASLPSLPPARVMRALVELVAEESTCKQ